MFKFASVPVIVIEEELFDPEPTVMPAVDPSVKVPFATESETESEAHGCGRVSQTDYRAGECVGAVLIQTGRRGSRHGRRRYGVDGQRDASGAGKAVDRIIHGNLQRVGSDVIEIAAL